MRFWRYGMARKDFSPAAIRRSRSRASEFVRKNPALELLAVGGICSASVALAWKLADFYPEPEIPLFPVSDLSKKDTKRLNLKLREKNYFLRQEHSQLLVKNSRLMEENKNKIQLLNKESDSPSSRKPCMMGSEFENPIDLFLSVL